MQKQEDAKLALEAKESYRQSCLLRNYEKARIARDIIADAYHRAYPHAFRRLPADGICHCQNPISHGEIQLTLDERGHEHHSHQSCRSWACPICAPKRAYARSKELEKALLSANEKGYRQFFVTFTVPHTKKHTSRHVIDLLNACYRRFTNAHAIRRLKAECGYVGAIKCLDYTITDNGTHAHLHTVWIFDSDAELHELGTRIAPVFLEVWDRQVRNACGKRIHQKFGFNFECMELNSSGGTDAEAIAKYAAKSISIYCSDGDKSKDGSVTPFDLLSSDSTDEQRARYLDFYRGQKGRRHIMFSPGLKELLHITDGSESRAPAAVIAYLKYEHAYFLKEEAARLEFESRASESVADALDWLESETARQQAELRRLRPFDDHGIKLPIDLEIVREEYVVRNLDEQHAELGSRIIFHAKRQDRFKKRMARRRHIARSHISSSEEYRCSLIDQEALSSTHGFSNRRPQSGLGAFMAQAEFSEPMPSVICRNAIDTGSPDDVEHEFWF